MKTHFLVLLSVILSIFSLLQVSFAEDAPDTCVQLIDGSLPAVFSNPKLFTEFDQQYYFRFAFPTKRQVCVRTVVPDDQVSEPYVSVNYPIDGTEAKWIIKKVSKEVEVKVGPF